MCLLYVDSKAENTPFQVRYLFRGSPRTGSFPVKSLSMFTKDAGVRASRYTECAFPEHFLCPATTANNKSTLRGL